jgi:hypothetical protein
MLEVPNTERTGMSFFPYLPSSSLSSSTAAIHHLYLGWHPPLPPRPPRNPRTLCSGRARLSAQSSPSQGGRRPKEEGDEGEDLRAPLAGAGSSALAAARGDEKEGVASRMEASLPEASLQCDRLSSSKNSFRRSRWRRRNSRGTTVG